jgi:hypothetical protein
MKRTMLNSVVDKTVKLWSGLRLFNSHARALQLCQIAASLILLVASSVGSASAQDLAREVLAPEYAQLKMNLLHLHCQLGFPDGTACHFVIEEPIPDGGGVRFPEVPGSGGNRSIIPRPRDPRNPMSGSIDIQTFPKVGTSISINAADIGFASYPVSFQLNGTRLADDLVRWEGFTPQPDFCLVTALNPLDIRMIRIRGIGANLCTRVSQIGSPEDDSGLRFYKGLALANESVCNVSDPALNDAIELSAAGGTGERLGWVATRGRNFLMIRARTYPLQPEDLREYDRRLSEEQAAVRADNDRRRMRCLGIDESRRSADPECRERAVPATTFFTPSPDVCHRYPIDGGAPVNIVTSIEQMTGLAGRPRAGAVTPSQATAAISLGDNGICQYTVNPGDTRPLTTLPGTLFISRPTTRATTADEQFELARMGSVGLSASLRSSASSGVSVLPAAVSTTLPAGRSETTRFQVRVGDVNGDPNFNGRVEVVAEGPSLVEPARTSFHVVTTDTFGLCGELQYQLDLYRASLASTDVAWPLDMDDPPKLFERFKTVDMRKLGQKGLDSWNRLWAMAMPPAVSSGKANVAGSWTVQVQTDQGPASFALSQNGDEISGNYKGALGEAPIRGTIKGDQITLFITVQSKGIDTTIVFSGIIEKGLMTGTVNVGNLENGSWTAKRQ